MIYGRANLLVSKVTSSDKGINILNNVHFGKEGETVGIDGSALMVVSPLPEKVSKQFLLRTKEELPAEGVSVKADRVKEVEKSMPIDKQFGGLLEQVVVDRSGDKHVEFTVTDGVKESKVAAPVHRKPYPAYKKILNRVLGRKEPARICVNRKRLIALLQSIDKACADSSGENSVFIETDSTGRGEVLIRALNDKTGQTAIGIMSQYSFGTEWLERTEWERSLIKKSAKIKRRA